MDNQEQPKKEYFTQDLDFAVYLKTQDINPTSTQKVGQFTQFSYPPGIADLYTKWQFSPTPDMVVIQDFLFHRKKILEFIRPRGNF